MPRAKQIAALPVRWTDEGKVRVLMVTSRGTGRWVMPKGWVMDGKKPWHAAEIEALEEAGAIGRIASEPLGKYRYEKELGEGELVPIKVTVYPMLVRRLKANWKERQDRERRWFSLSGAAARVDEPDLRKLLLNLDRKPRKRRVLKALKG